MALAQLYAKLGHEFRDPELLRQALTHSSSVAPSRNHDYQRLEFLGDRVLALVVAEALYIQKPDRSEGDMATLHSQLVRGGICANIGRALGFDAFIILGDGEMRNGLNQNASLLGDVVEAVIGALYLDAGLEAARAFVLSQWRPLLDQGEGTLFKDPKTRLQEWALARRLPIPHYDLLGREGKAHSPHFTVRVEVQGFSPSDGEGSSKRAAEMEAASAFLLRQEGHES